MIRRRHSLRQSAMLALIGLALAVRLLVPAGWMPAEGRGFAITLCTGTATETVWVDTGGTTHKQAPATAPDHPCAFAGIAAPMIGGETALAVPAPVELAVADPVHPLVAVGRGLAAPPPPATGPPAIL